MPSIYLSAQAALAMVVPNLALNQVQHNGSKLAYG
jgi:hypothetical protein